jgi:hypothetical protein
LNGAVEFDDHYSPPGDDVYRLVARHLELPWQYSAETGEIFAPGDKEIAPPAA